MAQNDEITKNDQEMLTDKDLNGIALRSGYILGAMNYERMQALGFLCAILKPLQ